MTDIRVVAFAGSLRRASYNRGLIRAVAEASDPASPTPTERMASMTAVGATTH